MTNPTNITLYGLRVILPRGDKEFYFWSKEHRDEAFQMFYLVEKIQVKADLNFLRRPNVFVRFIHFLNYLEN